MSVLYGIMIGVFITIAFFNFLVFLCRRHDRNFLAFAACFFFFAGILFFRRIYFYSTFYNRNLYFIFYHLICYFTAGSILYAVIAFFKIQSIKIIISYVIYYAALGITLCISFYMYFFKQIDLIFSLFIIPASVYAIFGIAIPLIEIFVKKRATEKKHFFFFISMLILLVRLLSEPLFIRQHNPFLSALNSVFILSGSFFFAYVILKHFMEQNQMPQGKEDFCGSFVSRFGISEREREIIEYIMKGSSNQEIASRLFISIKTVESHIYNIYKKTGSKNRIHLISIIRGKSEEIQSKL